MKRAFLVLALLTLLLTACRAEVRVVLEVTENGSGTLRSDVGVDNELQLLINQLFGADGENIIAELDLGLEGTSETRLEGDLTVYSTEVEFTDVSGIAAASAGNFTEFSLEMTDDGTALEATLDLAGELDLAQFPVDPASIDPANLQATVIVSLPGEATDHNADSVLDDGRFSWIIPLDSELYMFANTEYPKSGFPWWLAGLLALSGGLALAVWLAAVRRDKKTGATRRAAPEPPPVTPPEPAAEPKQTDSPFFDLD
ncbi:MAG: hypothetical protein QNJ77_05310 [Acidimicrobiia bacterium]|nr:hypothetical protein [Acidimicrobiia bacterium]